MQFEYKEYKILASQQPTEKTPSPTIFESSVYAKNTVAARSKVSQLLKRKYKIKNALFLSITETKEENPEFLVKNYGVQFVYQSKSGKHNMYKEFRALCRADAVGMLYHDMAGRHRAKPEDIKIISVEELEVKDLRRLNVLQFARGNVEFPVFRKKIVVDETFVGENVKFYD